MRLGNTLSGSLFILERFGQVSAGGINDVVHGLHHQFDTLGQQMRRDADMVVHQRKKRADVFGAPGGVWPTVVVPPGFTLAAGVEITPIPGIFNTFASIPTATPTPGAPPASVATPLLPQSGPSPGTINPVETTAQVDQACMTAVMSLKGNSGNPAGLAVCYNVPFLDQQRGTFEAELRLYNISAPNGDFIGIPPTMMTVTLQYEGATIQKSNGTLPTKRHLVELADRQLMPSPTITAMPPSGAMPAGISMPSEVALRKYVGQVNKNLMTPGMNL